MTELDIHVDAHTTRLGSVPFPLELVEQKSHRRLEKTSALGESTRVRVAPGDYEITAHLPTGIALRTNAHVERGECHRVNLQAHLNTLDTELSHSRVGKSELFRLVRWGEARESIELKDGTGRQLELSFWESEGKGHFSRAELPAPGTRWAESVWQVEDLFSCLDLRPVRPNRPLWVMVCTGKRLVQLVALPPAKRLTIAIGKGNQRGQQPRVVVTGDIVDAEALLAYLHHGSLMAARLLGPVLVNKQMDGRVNREVQPSAAAVAGYFSLHRSNHPPEFGQWLEHFAASTSWLPDSNVIYASHLLLRKKPDFSKVRAVLFGAWQRGIPIYTEGVRRLAKGFARLKEISSAHDPELEQASNEVSRLAMFTDPTVATTTIYNGTGGSLHSLLHLEED